MDGYNGLLKQALISGTGFRPIGSQDGKNSFYGTFDGDNKAICSLYQNINTNGKALAGFFLRNYGEIRNLGLVNVNITAIAQGENSASVGGIARVSYNKIINCYVTGNIKTEGTSWMSVGGICGAFDTDESSIENCYNLANIECKNIKKEKGDSDISCGGILGQSGYGGNINKCFNKGNINVDGGVNTVNLGGICGVFYMNGTIKNSYNDGRIECTNKGFVAEGGIVGNIVYNVQESVLVNCYNTGEISGNVNNLEGNIDIGGIVGLQYSKVSISNIYNIGKIMINSEGNLNAGGISGYANSNAVVDNAYNTGILQIQNVNGVNTVGSITGNFITLSNCYYLKGTYDVGVGESGSSTGITQLDSIEDFPSVLDVVNGEEAFKEDTNNVNNGYPILEWQ